MKGSACSSFLARRQETWVLLPHTTGQEIAETMKSFMTYHKAMWVSGPETGTKGVDVKAVGYVTKEVGRPKTRVRKLGVGDDTKAIKSQRDGSRQSGSSSKLVGEMAVLINTSNRSWCPTLTFLHLLWPPVGKRAKGKDDRNREIFPYILDPEISNHSWTWCMCVLSNSAVSDSDSFVTPRTVARQAPLYLGLSRQEHWSSTCQVFLEPYSAPNSKRKLSLFSVSESHISVLIRGYSKGVI